MNSLEGHIGSVEVSGSLSLVSVQFGGGICLKVLVIETPETASYLVAGHSIQVLIKETEVVIGTLKNPHLSLENIIEGTIQTIEKAALLCRLEIQTAIGKLHAVISSNAAERLRLREGLTVYAMVKLNEIMLSE